MSDTTISIISQSILALDPNFFAEHEKDLTPTCASQAEFTTEECLTALDLLADRLVYELSDSAKTTEEKTMIAENGVMLAELLMGFGAESMEADRIANLYEVAHKNNIDLVTNAITVALNAIAQNEEINNAVDNLDLNFFAATVANDEYVLDNEKATQLLDKLFEKATQLTLDGANDFADRAAEIAIILCNKGAILNTEKFSTLLAAGDNVGLGEISDLRNHDALMTVVAPRYMEQAIDGYNYEFFTNMVEDVKTERGEAAVEKTVNSPIINKDGVPYLPLEIVMHKMAEVAELPDVDKDLLLSRLEIIASTLIENGAAIRDENIAVAVAAAMNNEGCDRIIPFLEKTGLLTNENRQNVSKIVADIEDTLFRSETPHSVEFAESVDIDAPSPSPSPETFERVSSPPTLVATH